MPQLNYAVDTQLRRLRIYFNEKNPVESALLKQALVQFKMFGYKVPGTSLVCIELSITEQLTKDFVRYSDELEAAAVTSKEASAPKKSRKKKGKDKNEEEKEEKNVV
jgi:hypothetical protein